MDGNVSRHSWVRDDDKNLSYLHEVPGILVGGGIPRVGFRRRDPVSSAGEQSIPLHLDRVGTHWPTGWSTDNGAGGDVKLAAVAGARHRRTIELAVRQRATHVSTRIVEGVQISVRVRYGHLSPLEIESSHLPWGDVI